MFDGGDYSARVSHLALHICSYGNCCNFFECYLNLNHFMWASKVSRAVTLICERESYCSVAGGAVKGTH